MAGCAFLDEHNLAAGVVARQRRLGHDGVAASGQLRAGRRSPSQKERIGRQGGEHLVAQRRRLAVHREAEAALQPLLEGVDLAGLLAERGIAHIGLGQRRGIGEPPGIEVAVRAPQRVADIGAGMSTGIGEDRLAELHGSAELVVGNGAVRRRGKGLCRRCGAAGVIGADSRR